MSFIEQIHAWVRRADHNPFAIPGRPASGASEHARIIDAIEAGDAELAERLTREHMQGSYDRRLHLLMQAQRQSNSGVVVVSMVMVGCDVGGTFTDFIFIDPSAGSVVTGKVLTTPVDPSEAILAGIQDYSAKRGGDFGFARHVVHGTTLGINALLERRGARTGLLVTEGFRDILDIRRCARVDMYDLSGDFPPPLISRRDRRDVRERIYSDGSVLQSLDEDHARAQIKSLLEDGVEAIAICTLHSYLNADHEIRLSELVAEANPAIPVSLSSQVAGEIKEFERLSTTAIDAYLKPKMHAYLTKLDKNLRARGFAGDLYLMLSGGTVVAAKTGKRMPARLVESGPMSGAIAAKHFAKKSGATEIISYDMGGTSAKACLLQNGEVPITREYEVDRSFRFKRGSGMPLMVPTVDLIEIGAGGGSIAKIDGLGLLKVGPQAPARCPDPPATVAVARCRP